MSHPGGSPFQSINVSAPLQGSSHTEIRATPPIRPPPGIDLIVTTIWIQSNQTLIEDRFMPKAYWISFYREVMDPQKLAAYAKLAGPAIEAGGGRFLARAVAAQAHEQGLLERTVVIEFDSLEQACATHDSPAYKEALAALDGGVLRDLRIVPGV
jgi:uncharacterized protein (DUF1330 family)